MLVVEDGRDRASRRVVGATGDPRVRLLRLPRTSGSQAGPNALGWRRARAPVIAYLGHDDIWHPEHLAHLLEGLSAEVDVVHATTLMLGHPHAGPLLAGRRVWTPGTFVPPSSIAHRRDHARLGTWPRSAAQRRTVDYEFLERCSAAGARFAASGRPTVFKYPASWGMDAYRTRDVARQAAIADRLERDPGLGRELEAEALAAGADPVLPYDPPPAAAGVIADYARRQRGLPRRFAPPLRRWDADTPFDHPGWHGVESSADGGHHRWTGHAERASVRLDAPRRPIVAVRIEVVYALAPEQLAGLVVDLDGAPLSTTVAARPDGTHLVLARAWRRPSRSPVEVGVRAPLLRPTDLDAAARDRRRLGVAVRSITVA